MDDYTGPLDLAALAAFARYPEPWDMQRRAAFVAGVVWLRSQVMHGGSVPEDAALRRRLAVAEAYPRG